MNSVDTEVVKKNILIVEDDAPFRVMLGEALSDDYQVSYAENGITALHALAQREFDLIITDIIMPNLDGINLLTQLRRVSQSQKVIAMSGGSYLDWHYEFKPIEQLIGDGIVLRKPFSLKLLRAAIKKMLFPSNAHASLK